MSPRPNADFLRGLLAAYALYLAWINAWGLWMGVGIWVRYHQFVPLQMEAALALLALYLFIVFALALPKARRLLAAALLFSVAALVPVIVVIGWWRQQPQDGFLGGFARNETVRLAAAAGAWRLYRLAARLIA